MFLAVIKIYHFFLLKNQYPSIQNSHFGGISPDRSDRSHKKIILRYIFGSFRVILQLSQETNIQTT